MTYAKIEVGQLVYHAVFPHWGYGRVLEKRQEDRLGYKTSKRVLVAWSARMTAWMRSSELRKTARKQKWGKHK